MADFSTSAELAVSVSDQELAGVRQQIERELSNINVGVQAGGGGQPRDPRTGQFMSPQGGEQRLVDLADLAERRNVLLQQIQESITQAAVTDAQAGGGGAGAGGTLLQVAGAQSILGGLGIGGAGAAGAGGLGILAGVAGPALLVEALLGTEQVTSNLLGGDGSDVSPQTSGFFGGRPEWFDSTPAWWDEEPPALGSMTPEDPAVIENRRRQGSQIPEDPAVLSQRPEDPAVLQGRSEINVQVQVDGTSERRVRQIAESEADRAARAIEAGITGGASGGGGPSGGPEPFRFE